MDEDIMAQTDAETLSSSKKDADIATESTDAKAQSRVMRFAQDAVGAQVGRVSEVLNSTAASIDELLGGTNSPLPDRAKGLVSSTSGKLRDMAERATEEEAGKLLETLQRTAAEHPGITAGLGAALGAALGLAVAKLGRPTPSATQKSKAESD
jgi:hypothetical protein